MQQKPIIKLCLSHLKSCHNLQLSNYTMRTKNRTIPKTKLFNKQSSSQTQLLLEPNKQLN